MKVIIIGAGIGGLCAGMALRRLGHEVDIFEKVTRIRPVGAGLSLWPNGIRCLDHLGCGAEVAAMGGRMDGMAYADGTSGATLTRFDLSPLYDRSGARAYPVARAELQNMLMEKFGHDRIHLGAELRGLDQGPDGVEARFGDGRVLQGDLLIGADGAHSPVRAHVLGQTLVRRSAGYTNWNGIIDVDPAIAPVQDWTTFVAEGKRASVMPIGTGRFYFFLDVPTALQHAPQEDRIAELRGYFGHWAAPVQHLINRISPHSLNRVDIHDIDPFDTWVRGRMILLGDSAHNTTPDLGQGACMAMEDAVVLEHALRSHVDLGAALLAYQEARATRCRDLVLRARERSDVTHGTDPALTEDWYRLLRMETGEGILKGIQRTVDGGPLAA